MKIEYTYSTRMIIVFDDQFEVNLQGTLDNAVDKIKWAMKEYSFTCAEAIDSETGEILIIVKDD